MDEDIEEFKDVDEFKQAMADYLDKRDYTINELQAEIQALKLEITRLKKLKE